MAIKHFCYSFLLALLAATFFLPGLAQKDISGQKLTLDEAIDLALKNHPAIKGRFGNYSGVCAAGKQAGQYLLAVLVMLQLYGRKKFHSSLSCASLRAFDRVVPDQV